MVQIQSSSEGGWEHYEIVEEAMAGLKLTWTKSEDPD